MTRKGRDIALWLAALLGAPLLFGAYVALSYRFALAQGHLPLAVFPEWYWYVAFAVCLLGGAAAVYSTSLQPWRLRVGLGIGYAALMAVGLLAVHLAVACTSGDCL